MKNRYNTLWEVFDAVSLYCEKNKVVSDEFKNFMCTGGIGYNESRRFSFEIDSLKGRNTRKGLQVIICRLDCGKYELVNYVL